MEKISKLFGMLVLGLASSGLAMNTLSLSCTTEVVDKSTGLEGEAPQLYMGFDCVISQLLVKKDELADNEYATWDDLLRGINLRVSDANDMIDHVNITLASDIVFDAIPTNPAECTNSMMGEFELYFPGMGDAENNFNGNGHTISNFCRISEGTGDAAFFKEYKNGSIKNVIFDNAYVLSKLSGSIGATEARAAVVVSQAIDVVFDSVVVKNSKVYGLTAGAVADSIVNGSLKRISVVNTDVGAPAAVFPEYTGGRPDATSIYTAVGGVAAYTNGVGVFENISLTGVSVGVSDVASVPYEFMGQTEMVHETAGFYMREIGGVIGDASYYSSSTFSYKGGSVGVTVGNGAYMGGIFGKLYARSDSIEVNNVSANVTVQPTCQSNYYVGGLAGSADISMAYAENNKVTMSADWSESTCDVTPEEMFMGGLIGYTEYQQMQLDLFYDTVTTTIATGTAYNGGGHLMGGLLGSAKNLSIRMVDNVTVSNISDLATTTDSTQVGGLIGGSRKTNTRDGDVLYFYRSNFTNALKVAATTNVAVGGLAGKIVRGDSGLEIFHNKGQGNMEVPTATGVLAGYGVGSMMVAGMSAAGNFYVGKSDSNVPNFVGAYVGQDGGAVSWGTSSDKDDYTDICFNYRNAVKGLDATSTPWRWATGEFYSDGRYSFNGILSDSAMKTCAFAHALNDGVSRKRGGASDETHLLNKSWICEEGNLPTYDYDSYEKPYAPYMLTVDYRRVAGQMTDAQKVAMAPYMAPGTENQFTTFTTNTRNLDKNFVAAFNNLDWDYYMFNGISENTRLGGDQTFEMYENRQFKVSYKYTYDGSDYYDFDEAHGTMLFYTPKVATTSLLDDDHLVPSIRVVGGVAYEYHLDGFVINCKEDAACDAPIENFGGDTVVTSFAQMLRSYVSRDFSKYSDTLHLIYKSISYNPRVKNLPRVYFANSGSVAGVIATTYGYTSANEITSISGGTSLTPIQIDWMNLAGEIGFATTTGFIATGWKVDLWVGFKDTYTAENVASCYGDDPMAACTDKVIAANADRFVGTLDKLADSLMAGQSDNLWKWTINLEVDETIDMKNLINAFSKVVNANLNNPLIYMHITPKGTVTDYTITFVPNAGDNEIFFADSWNENGVYNLSTANLPVMYSTSADFNGWSAIPDNQYRFYSSTVTPAFLDSLVRDQGKREDYKYTAYGSWSEGYDVSSRDVILLPSTEGQKIVEGEKPFVFLNGSVTFKQAYVQDKETVWKEHPFDRTDLIENDHFSMSAAFLAVPQISEDMTFYVESKPNVGYRLKSLKDSIETAMPEVPAEPTMAAEGGASKTTYGLEVNGTDTLFRVEGDPSKKYFLIADFEPIPYHITFTRELGDEWFYAKDWRDTAIYTIDSFADYQSPFPKIYSVKGASLGWHYDAAYEDGGDYTPTFYHNVDLMNDGLYEENTTLYMIASEEEEQTNMTVSINKDAVDLVRLVQFIGEEGGDPDQDSVSHRFTAGESVGEMLMPTQDNVTYEFFARINVEEGYAIDTAEYSYKTYDGDAEEPRTVSFENGSKIEITTNLMYDVQFKVKLKKRSYEIAFSSTVEDAISDGTSLETRTYSVDDDDFTFPRGVYTNESCLLGWKLQSAADGEEPSLLTAFGWELADLLRDQDTLVAVWGDAATCDAEISETDAVSGEYNRLVLEAEGGNVQLVQMGYDDQGAEMEIRTREFGDNMFMLMPREISEETWYVVKIVADEDHKKLDSVLFTYDEARLGENAEDETYAYSIWLHDGDRLPQRSLLGAVLKADFVLANKTPIEIAEVTNFVQSGDSVHLEFTTSEFDVERNVYVKTTLITGEDTTVVMDTVKTSPHEYSKTLGKLADGDYLLTVKVYDETESDVYDTTFTVNTTAIAFAEDPFFELMDGEVFLSFVTSEFDANRNAYMKITIVHGTDSTVVMDTVEAVPYEYADSWKIKEDGEYHLRAMVYDEKDTAAFDTTFVIEEPVVEYPEIAFAEDPFFEQKDNEIALSFVTSEFDVNRNAYMKIIIVHGNDTTVVKDTVKTVPYEYANSWEMKDYGEYYLLVMVYDEKDTVPFERTFTIEGPAVEYPEIAFADVPNFKQTGAAARLTFTTSEFDVEREVLVKTVVVRNGDSAVVVDSVKKVPYVYMMDTVGLAPGEYLISVLVSDGVVTVPFDTSFAVTSGIEAVAMDGWQMLALDVIDKESVDWKDSDAVFFWWDEASSVGEYWQYKAFGEKDYVENVTGGWYSSLEGRALEIRKDLEIPAKAEWKLDSVYSGWNLVANPYGWPIANPDTTLESWRWNSETCDYDTTRPWFLKPYEAIWVHVGSDTTLTLDKTPVFDTTAVKSPAKRRVLAKVNNAFDWSIRATLKDEMGRTDSWNVLGVGDVAKVSEPPEGMGNHVNLSIMDGRRRLAKSMKQVSEDGYTWNLEVSATSNRRGFLGFEGMDRLAALGYRLFVTVDERTVEMTDGQELPVALKSLSKSVKVQVVKSEAQLATSVSGLKMVQQGDRVNVSFNVPSELSGSGFIAEVAALDGKKLTSSRGKAVSGRNEVSLTIPQSGLYYVRVRVASQQTAGKFLAK